MNKLKIFIWRISLMIAIIVLISCASNSGFRYTDEEGTIFNAAMTSDLRAETIDDYESAIALYQRYLTKYPQGRYIEGAKKNMDSIRIKIEEIKNEPKHRAEVKLPAASRRGILGAA